MAASCSTNRHSATAITLTDTLTLTTNQLHHRNQILDLTADTRLTVDSIQITLPPDPGGNPRPRITLKGLKSSTRSHQSTQTTDTTITQTAAQSKSTTTATQTTQQTTGRATPNPLLFLLLILILLFLILKTLSRKR